MHTKVVVVLRDIRAQGRDDTTTTLTDKTSTQQSARRRAVVLGRRDRFDPAGGWPTYLGLPNLIQRPPRAAWPLMNPALPLSSANLYLPLMGSALHLRLLPFPRMFNHALYLAASESSGEFSELRRSQLGYGRRPDHLLPTAVVCCVTGVLFTFAFCPRSAQTSSLAGVVFIPGPQKRAPIHRSDLSRTCRLSDLPGSNDSRRLEATRETKRGHPDSVQPIW